MAKYRGTDFNFGANVKPRKPKGSSKKPKGNGKGKRRGGGASFGS